MHRRQKPQRIMLRQNDQHSTHINLKKTKKGEKQSESCPNYFLGISWENKNVLSIIGTFLKNLEIWQNNQIITASPI